VPNDRAITVAGSNDLMRVSRLQAAIVDVVRESRRVAVGYVRGRVVMRFAKLSALALVALSLVSTDALASPVNRKFHPVVNDDPQNAHLNVQTPGADINQTVDIKGEAGPDGQVIPAGDAKVAACAIKDSNGDIDLSGGGSCWSPKASAPIAERASVAASTSGSALSPSPRAASRTVHVPSHTAVSVARVGHASSVAPVHAVEAVRGVAPLPAHRIVRTVLSLPGKQLAPVRANTYETARMRWIELGLFGFAATVLLALGIVLMFRMGLGGLLLMRRRDEAGDEGAARDGQSTVPAVVQKI